MKVYIIDNGGQWTHREYRVLRDLEIDVHIVPNTIEVEKLKDGDAIVLSGGAPSITNEVYKLGGLGRIVDEFQGPILGICAGHQFLAAHYGGSVERAEIPEFGPAEISIIRDHSLFEGFPKKFIGWESHNDEVKSAPGFILLASSENCKYQAMVHEKRPIFGVQFHPEVEHTENGTKLFENFLRFVKV